MSNFCSLFNFFLNLFFVFVSFRNVSLVESGFTGPKMTKTGTTIVGCIFGAGDDIGVCLGADTRATSGDIVADKNCMKIHRIADRI